MKKKFLALALTAVMALSLAACGGDTQSTDTDADTSGDESASGSQTYTVGIIQQVQHEALDAATQGFQDALTELLGDSVTIDPQNASGDTANCTTIANNFVSQGVDLIMANGTTALQAAATGTSTIPILGTSITEYGVALGIDGFTGTTGYNVSGTSDLAPLDQQAEMLHTWFPDAQTVGLLYCSAEPNSEYQVKVVEDYLSNKGITCTRYSFSDSNDVAAVTTKAAADSDVIYIPTDNTAASCTETIGSIVRSAKTPVVAGEQGICVGCGIMGIGGYYMGLNMSGSFNSSCWINGYGWIAVALVIFANWNPALAVLGTFVFGFFNTLRVSGSSLAAAFPEGLGWLAAVPTQLYQALPFLITAIVLVVSSIRQKGSGQPAALGLNYFREER